MLPKEVKDYIYFELSKAKYYTYGITPKKYLDSLSDLDLIKYFHERVEYYGSHCGGY